MIVLLHTLARIDEALRLKWEDINFEKRILIKRTPKTRSGAWKEISIKINDEHYHVLWKMWQKRSQETWVFFNKRTQDRYYHRPKFMKSLCKKADVKSFGFHSIRHFMLWLLNDDPKVSTKTIQKILGHSNQRTTEIYLHEIDGFVEKPMDSIGGKLTEKELNPQPPIKKGLR